MNALSLGCGGVDAASDAFRVVEHKGEVVHCDLSESMVELLQEGMRGEDGRGEQNQGGKDAHWGVDLVNAANRCGKRWARARWGMLVTLPCQGMNSLATGGVRGVGPENYEKCAMNPWVEAMEALHKSAALDTNAVEPTAQQGLLWFYFENSPTLFTYGRGEHLKPLLRRLIMSGWHIVVMKKTNSWWYGLPLFRCELPPCKIDCMLAEWLADAASMGCRVLPHG
jgi:hypothetical protein